VEAVPVLGSGKLDLAKCQQLADERFAADKGSVGGISEK